MGLNHGNIALNYNLFGEWCFDVIKWVNIVIIHEQIILKYLLTYLSGKQLLFIYGSHGKTNSGVETGVIVS